MQSRFGPVSDQCMACSVFLPSVAAKQRLVSLRIQNILFHPRKELGCPPCGGSINQIRPKPPSRYVFKIEVLRGPPIRERDFKAPAEGDGFMLDDSDACGHDAMIARALADGQRLVAIRTLCSPVDEGV
jgi:hypothetical protein